MEQESTTEAPAKETPAKETPAKAESPNLELDVLLDTADGKEFLKISELSGKTTKQKLYEDEHEAEQFKADYHAWIQAKKPKPEMPNIEGKINVPCSIVRVIDRAQPYYFVEYQDGTIEGIEYKIRYAQEEGPDGKKYDTNIIESRTPQYQYKWNKSNVKKVIETAKKLVQPHQGWSMYTKQGDALELYQDEEKFLAL